ncbi:MAG: glutamate--cysteine ligase [Alphaproteobacteria bacterium]
MSGIPFDTGAPIETRAQLLSYFEQGSRPTSDWKVGVEIEAFLYDKKTCLPIGQKNIEYVFEQFSTQHGWVIHFDEGFPVSATKGASAINLEPGGQIELSSAPHVNMHDYHAEQTLFLQHLEEICLPSGIGILFTAVFPKKWESEALVNGRTRYQILRKALQAEGTLGTEMMGNTCGTHINVDYGSEKDMGDKFKLGLALQPIVSALFASSPFRHGKPSGYFSTRKHFWHHTSPPRCDLPADFFRHPITFERYLDFALDVPMLFILRDGVHIPMDGTSFRAFMKNSKDGHVASMGDFENHLTTIFSPIRLKNYMEFRGADIPGSPEDALALTAFWQGILYDQISFDAALLLIKEWTADEMMQLEQDAPSLSLETVFRGEKLSRILLRFFDLAEAGLKRRGVLNAIGADESIYLQSAYQRIKSGELYAERLLRLYHRQDIVDLKALFMKEPLF